MAYQALWEKVSIVVVLCLLTAYDCSNATSKRTTTKLSITRTMSSTNVTMAPTAKATTTTTRTTLSGNTTLSSSTMATTTRKTTTSKMTTPTSNMTTPASNTTTPTINTTTPTSNMTTPTSNMTTPSSNATTPTSNMTTPTSNMTTPTSNMTTPSSNTTTTTSNMTTAFVTTPSTPAPPPVDWKVKDKAGHLCMLMGFNGTITYISNDKNKTNVTVDIPVSAETNMSSCQSDKSQFLLEFSSKAYLWQIEFVFTADNSLYELSKILVYLYSQSGREVTYGSKENVFSVPLGDYYQCDSFNKTAGPFLLNLTSPIFQPFVNKTIKGDLGDSFVCGSRLPASKTITVIIGVIIALVVVAIVIGIMCSLVKKRRPTTADPPYARVN